MPERRGEQQRSADLVRMYLNDIGKHPLLSREDEARLGAAVEQGRLAAAELSTSADDGSTAAPTDRRRLRAVVREGERATEEFVLGNLRLVVSIAKRYQTTGLPLLDLVQEGNLGLMHAVEKFDYRKGFKFSTYATWWIRQAIARGVAASGRSIRLPIHARDLVLLVQRAQAFLEVELQRTPTAGDLARHLDLPLERVEQALSLASEPISLFEPLGDEGDGALADLIEDRRAPGPADAAMAATLPDAIVPLLGLLGDREREILRVALRTGQRRAPHPGRGRCRIRPDARADTSDRAAGPVQAAAPGPRGVGCPRPPGQLTPGPPPATGHSR